MPEPVALLGPLAVTLEDVGRARWIGPTVFVEPDPEIGIRALATSLMGHAIAFARMQKK